MSLGAQLTQLLHTSQWLAVSSVYSSVGRLFRHSRLPLWGARTDARCGETDRAILTTTNFKIVHAIIGLEFSFEGS